MEFTGEHNGVSLPRAAVNGGIGHSSIGGKTECGILLMDLAHVFSILHTQYSKCGVGRYERRLRVISSHQLLLFF